MNDIVFFGYGELGHSCLKELVSQGHSILFVFTHKDLNTNSVDEFSKANGIGFSYEDLRGSGDKKQAFGPNMNAFIISVNYRYIIPEVYFSLCKYAFNLHGSLLPKYRGRTPHVWSIINGESQAGVTAHLLEASVDTGDIIVQEKVPIKEEDTGASVLEKMQTRYPRIMNEAMASLEKGGSPKKQRHEDASYFGKRTPVMGYIDFYGSFEKINNFVRAIAEPYPGAYYYNAMGRKYIINKIEKSEKLMGNFPIGVLFEENNKVYVRCLDSVVVLVDFRIEG